MIIVSLDAEVELIVVVVCAQQVSEGVEPAAQRQHGTELRIARPREVSIA